LSAFGRKADISQQLGLSVRPMNKSCA